MIVYIRTISNKVRFVFCVICFTMIGLLFFQEIVGADLPPRPPRPENRSDSQPVSASIELQVWPATPAFWTVIQWKDGLDQWHNVDGWQGHLDSGSIITPAEGFMKRWSVKAKDFGDGPFRWQVYSTKNGKLLAESEPFELPDEPNETVLRQVLLK